MRLTAPPATSPDENQPQGSSADLTRPISSSSLARQIGSALSHGTSATSIVRSGGAMSALRFFGSYTRVTGESSEGKYTEPYFVADGRFRMRATSMMLRNRRPRASASTESGSDGERSVAVSGKGNVQHTPSTETV